MTAESQSSKILEELTGTARILADLSAISADSIVSKILIDKPAGSITLFAFDRGQRLSEHTSPYDAFLYVVEGKATVTIGGTEQELEAGQAVIMPALVPHAVGAEEPFKMLLVMIRGKQSMSGRECHQRGE